MNLGVNSDHESSDHVIQIKLRTALLPPRTKHKLVVAGSALGEIQISRAKLHNRPRLLHSFIKFRQALVPECAQDVIATIEAGIQCGRRRSCASCYGSQI